MKVISKYALLVLVIIAVACSSEDRFVGNPLDEYSTFSQISNVTAQPREGGVLLKWDTPVDSAYLYVEVRYKLNGMEKTKQVSKFTDSLLIEDLINKEPVQFSVQTIGNDTDIGDIFETEFITPIKRKPEVTYFPDELEQIMVTADMLETHTQEQTEGPKENLVDGDINTYWHSAWSSGQAPLPHWIQVNFNDEEDIGAFGIFYRQNSSNNADWPSRWAVEISDDGENWTRIYEMDDDNPDDKDKEIMMNFGKNYESHYFRFLILETFGNQNPFTNLGEILFYKMDSRVVDKEQEAEEKYYEENQ